MYFPESATVFSSDTPYWRIIEARKHGPVVVLPRWHALDVGECYWTLRVDNTFGQPSAKR